MKRSFAFVTMIIALVLFASPSFAVRQNFANLNMSIEVPENWRAREDTFPTIRNVNVPDVELTDQVNTTRFLWLFTDITQDEDGNPLTLAGIGNRFLNRYSNMNGRRVDNRNNPGYYAFEGFFNDGSAFMFIFVDDTYDNRVVPGRYLAYVYSSETLQTSEVTTITNSIIINGVALNQDIGDNPQKGDEPAPTPVKSGGGGGGGCNTGTGLLASLMTALSAMIFRKR